MKDWREFLSQMGYQATARWMGVSVMAVSGYVNLRSKPLGGDNCGKLLLAAFKLLNYRDFLIFKLSLSFEMLGYNTLLDHLPPHAIEQHVNSIINSLEKIDVENLMVRCTFKEDVDRMNTALKRSKLVMEKLKMNMIELETLNLELMTLRSL